MKLDELEKSMLRAARQGLMPSEADRQRHERELLARVALGKSAPRLVESPRAHSVSGLEDLGRRLATMPSAAPARLQLVSAGLAVGVLIGGALGYVWGRGTAERDRAERDRAELDRAELDRAELDRAERVVAIEPASGDGPTQVELELPSAALEPPPERAPAVGSGDERAPAESEGHAEAPAAEKLLQSDERAPTPRAVRTLEGRAGGRAAPAVAKPQSSLAIELSMLQRARRALNASNGRLALGIVQELDERFPQGVLLQERSATRILSLCLLGREEEARRFGAEFLARHSASVYADRVRASCAAAQP